MDLSTKAWMGPMDALEPDTKLPPKMFTTTGNDFGSYKNPFLVGAKTSRCRQSSLKLPGTTKGGIGAGRQDARDLVASSVPLQQVAAWGGLKRRSPLGALPNGMPQ
mmetsp:Transcript_83682/g.175038  ORF Transcript_83682/g.175038 Transcript_83682/m.175038 type:complete len:106 (-) Transcript_83682:227-544(-)